MRHACHIFSMLILMFAVYAAGGALFASSAGATGLHAESAPIHEFGTHGVECPAASDAGDHVDGVHCSGAGASAFVAASYSSPVQSAVGRLTVGRSRFEKSHDHDVLKRPPRHI